jgi:diaminopimelate epimerase
LEVLDAQTARVVVYERGAGLTRACGTGGGGAATVGVQKGLLSPDVDLRIHQPGGELVYRVSSDATSVWMTGPAKLVFRGTLADGLDEA